MNLTTAGAPAEVLSDVRQKLEERQCRTPGSFGIIERVYQRRRCAPGVFGARVLMDSGAVRYFDLLDVRPI